MRSSQILFAVLLLGTSACAAREPVVYARAGRADAERAVRACSADAQAARADGSLGRLARRSAQKASTTVPLAAGAGAAISRNAKGALAGAAVGAGLAVAGASIDELEDDSLYVAYMRLCLSDRGYQIIGWR